MNIYVKPDEIWDYFQKNKKHLEEVVEVIAEVELDDKTKLQVCITEDSGYPKLTLELEDDVLEKECAISKSDCDIVSRKLYTTFESTAERLNESFEVEEENEELINYEREDEILEALAEFLTVILDIPVDAFDDEELVAMILESFEEVLYNDFGLVIDRGETIVEEDGDYEGEVYG
ncbi:MAG: hypothetical protein IKI94_08875 [Ruminococcus sp.]|nr:hypothetical protein [Ruminococcus sp.]